MKKWRNDFAAVESVSVSSTLNPYTEEAMPEKKRERHPLEFIQRMSEPPKPSVQPRNDKPVVLVPESEHPMGIPYNQRPNPQPLDPEPFTD